MRWHVEQANCLELLSRLPPDSVDLCLFSPPYTGARLYLEDGKDLGIARDAETWAASMVQVFKACSRVCKGLIACVCEGQTKGYRWDAAPALLMADLHRAGFNLRRPCIYHRVGIPGSGGPDWWRGDTEYVVCVTRTGKLPWSDNTATGHPPKWAPGGEMSYRSANGDRKNAMPKTIGAQYRNGKPTQEQRKNFGPHRARRQAGYAYVPPEKSNPGNLISCHVGGGAMGNDLAHENEAPFPEQLVEPFILSFCPPNGIVLDCFCGSGTTGDVALQHGRRFLGCDLRGSQVRLTTRRLELVTPYALFRETDA
jgi:hypothetical protein